MADRRHDDTVPAERDEQRLEGARQSGLVPLLRYGLDHLFPPDPGSLRLLAAARATLAGVLTFFLVTLAGMVIAMPITDRVLGFAIALYIAAMVRDSTTGQKLVTIALAGLGAGATTILATLLGGHAIAGMIALPLLMFAVAYFAVRGPRYLSIGIVSLIGYIFAFVVKQPVETIPARLAVLALAAADAALIRCVLMPERPQADFERLQRAIRARIGRMFRRIGAAVTAGRWMPGGQAALTHHVHRLSEAILLAQARLAAMAGRTGVEGSRWLQLLEIGLAAERVAHVAQRDLGTPAERPAILAVLEAARMRDGVFSAGQAGGALGVAVGALAHILEQPPDTGPEPPAAPPAHAAGDGWRPAAQTALATTLAIFLSELILPDRWYWAAFAAFVMFQGTRSRGESIAKGLAFIVGTTGGLVAGAVLAAFLSGHDYVSLAVIIAAVFLAFQANGAAYGVMVFWITIILGLMFGMLGYFTFDVLLLRLEEAAVGVACGGFVACLVLVRREHAVMGEAAAAFLQALGALVRGSAAILFEGTPVSDLPTRLLAASQRFGELRTVAASRQAGFQMSHDDALQQRMFLFEGCQTWARELGDIALTGQRIADPGLAAPAHRAAESIEASLACLLNGSSPAHRNREAARDVVPALDDRPHRVVRLLLRIDSALAAAASAALDPAHPSAGFR